MACSTERARDRLEAVALPEGVGQLDLPSRQLFEQRYATLERLLSDPKASDRQLSQAFGGLGRVFHAYERTEDAARCYRNAASLDGEAFRWRYHLGRVARAEGRLEASQGHFESALELRPDDVPTLVWLAANALELDRETAAESYFEEALKRDPRCVRAQVGLGRIALLRDDAEAAIGHLEAAFSRQPGSAAIRGSLAMAYHEAGDFERAREQLGVAVEGPMEEEIAFDDPLGDAVAELVVGARAHDRRAGRAAAAGRWEVAAAELSRSLAADPDRVESRYGLAAALLRLERREDAVAELGELLRSRPDHAPAHLLLGQIHAHGGDVEAAEKHLRAALAADPDSAEARFALSDLLRASGRPAPPARATGTERMVRRLVALADNARPMQNKFMNRERLARLRRLEPPSEPAERAQLQLRLADELLRAGEPAEAARRYAEVAELAPRLGAQLSADFTREVRSRMASAHLRAGEQANCLERHNADACLVPISGDGVHRDESGSRAALAELAELLREDPDDLESRWLYNLAAMTLGEYPEAVPPEWLVPPASFASEHDVGRFVDVAHAAGLATVSLAGGVVIEDLDGDGYLDVMASSWGLGDPLRFFRNRHADGFATFEERTREAGLEGLTGGLNLVHADYDNDGDADVLVLRGAWLALAGRHPNSLLENRGPGADGTVVFEDVTERAGLLSFHPTQTAAWGDYDNDGWLDLFVGNESLPGDPHPCQLYRNNGPNAAGEVTFTEVAAAAGVDAWGDVKGVAWGDVDNDGWLDLYLSRLLEPNLLFHNQGASGGASGGPSAGATFREIASSAGVSRPDHSFPTWFFDYDNDGWLDLFAASYPRSYVAARAAEVAADYLGLETTAEPPRLYRNRGGATPDALTGEIAFDDATAAAGLDRVLLAMGVGFGDLDNDGWLDFYLGTGAPDFRVLVPNRMFRNAGGRRFQDVTTSGGFGHLQKGHGVVFADVDNDGDQDVFAVMGGAYSGDVYPNVLFANPGHGHRWVTLRLAGTRSNRSAIGARLRLEVDTPAGRRQIHATVGTGGSFGSASLQQEIGLGDALAVRAVEVRWPGGGRQTFRDLPMDRVLRLVEGQAEPETVGLERLRLPTGAAPGAAPHP